MITITAILILVSLACALLNKPSFGLFALTIAVALHSFPIK